MYFDYLCADVIFVHYLFVNKKNKKTTSCQLTREQEVWELTFQVFRGDEAEGDHEGDFLWEREDVSEEEEEEEVFSCINDL